MSLNAKLSHKTGSFVNPDKCYTQGKAVFVGGIVTLSYQGDIINISDYDKIGTLSTDFRPDFDVSALGTTGNNEIVNVVVSTNGDIVMHPYNVISSRTSFSFSISFAKNYPSA